MDAANHRPKKSTVKPRSGRKREWYDDEREWYDDEPALTIPAVASEPSPADDLPSTPAPEFDQWQKQDAHHYSDVKQQNKGPRGTSSKLRCVLTLWKIFPD
jgi:hypothetical protein